MIQSDYNSYLAMFNVNHAAEIRTSERVKFDQALYILTMYEKKIRTEINWKIPIDAEKVYEENIINSWNHKWRNDLTKPVLNCVSSVHPRVFLQYFKGQNEDLEGYNNDMRKFMIRMRAEYEDESNFKLIEKDILDERLVSEMGCAKFCVNTFTSSISRMLEKMKKSFEENQEKIENLLENSSHQSSYAEEIYHKLESLQNVIQPYQNKDEDQYIHLYAWVATIIKAMESIKESEFGSTFIAAQPEIGELTHLIHPLMLPIYANLLKEKQPNRKFQQCETSAFLPEGKTPFREFFASNTSQLSKVVFLNLDGFESEFNLEYARCFKKNMMYISFPKEDIEKNEENNIFEKRFFKKLMYNMEKNKMAYENEDGVSEVDFEQNYENQKYYLLNNPENYFKTVEDELYNFDKKNEDFQKNIFVFPLRLSSFQENLNLGEEEKFYHDEYETIEVYESYQILQIFKYFLINQIREFNPTSILVSYSGRIRLEDNHFIEIMQDLTKIAQYKVLMFPNLTPSFYPSQETDHVMSVKRMSHLSAHKTQLNYDFFNKISRFLKVTSGTHSLINYLECEPILSKFKHSQVLKKMNKLMEALGFEYEEIERIRFKKNHIDLIPKLFQQDTKKVIKIINRLVPDYYNDLYDLIKALVSVMQNFADQAVYSILQKFHIDPNSIAKLMFLQQMVEEMKERVCLVAEMGPEVRRRRKYELVIKQIETHKTKHFLELAEEKYEESTLLYFKILPNHVLFQSYYQVSEVGDKSNSAFINLTGLLDISFSHPSRELLQIFDSTQILYTVDQTKRGPKAEVPILIMNHLPMNPKLVSKFDNYCGFLNLDFNEIKDPDLKFPNSEKRIPERKKLLLYPIRFFDENSNEIHENRFEFRVQWNYAETQQYMILYWPFLFNMAEAICCKISGKNYEPPILNQIYIGRKVVEEKSVRFNKANIGEVVPRSGCSAYILNNNMVYIFGGFYAREKNYLDLQRDVTRLNLRHYDHLGTRKVLVENMKDTIYEQIKGSHGRRPFSYIRARREYEFYDQDDLLRRDEAEMVEEARKKVIMIGGYGENFLRPYSLITYYYFVLDFETASGELKSVEKKLVFNKAIPINIRGVSKNLGIIRTAVRKDGAQGKTISTRAQLSEFDSYARYRVVYQLGKDGDLNFKYQFLFTDMDCRVLKEDLRKLEEEKYEVRELSNIRLEKVDENTHNHLISVNSKIFVHLRLEISRKVKAEEPNQEYKLTHDSISFLKIINGNYVCAIIKHSLFTNNQSVVAECKVKSIENENLREDEHPYISLKPIVDESLVGDLTLHVVEASNINLVYVLHGYRLQASDKIYEYLIQNRKNETKKITKIKPSNQLFREKDMPRYCLSTFFNKKSEERYEIICESYLAFDQGNAVTRVDESFEQISDDLCWKPSLNPPLSLVFVLEGHTSKPINIDRIEFQEFWRQKEKRIFIALYKGKKYFITLSGHQNKLSSGEVIAVLSPATESDIRNLEREKAEKGSILVKKPNLYIDRGYIEDL